MKPVKANEEEKRNGWTDETLNKYRRERERSGFTKIYERPNTPPVVQNHQYSPFKWNR